MNQADFDKLKFCVVGNLRKTSRAATLFGDSVLQKSGLKVTQFIMLATIGQNQPLSVSKLSEKMLMDQTSVTRSLKPLKDSALVASAKGEDGRTRMITLTDAGSQKLDEVMPLWEKAQSQIVSELGQTHFEALLHELATVIEALE